MKTQILGYWTFFMVIYLNFNKDGQGFKNQD